MKATDRESRLAKLLADALDLVPRTPQNEPWRTNARIAIIEPHSGNGREPPELIKRLQDDLAKKVSS